MIEFCQTTGFGKYNNGRIAIFNIHPSLRISANLGVFAVR